MAARLRVDRGFTLPELILVVALLGLAVMVAIPRILTSIHFARANGYAHQIEMSVRAVRMIAVSTQTPQALTVRENRFEYVDLYGRARVFELPEGARIAGYSAPIEFRFLPNGSLEGGSRQVIVHARINDSLYTDSWTVTSNLVGSTRVTHEKLEPPQS